MIKKVFINLSFILLVFITEFVCLSACVKKKISDTRSISKSIHKFVPSEIPDSTLIDNECDLKKLEII